MNALLWNIRSVNTQGAFERLITMHRKYQFDFIGLMEPMQQSRKLDGYRRQIDFEQAFVNIYNKIWVFIDGKYDVTMEINSVRQLILRLFDTEEQKEFMITLVYAKCDHIDRIELWDSLYYLAQDMTIPWLVGGDFNVIWDEEEKFGGLPVPLNEVDDFKHCMTTCNFSDLGFKGSIYTWSNGRVEKDYIFKRLDIVFANFEAQQLWPGMEKLKKALSTWSRATFGDIFQKIASLEEVVRVYEAQFEINPTIQNRERLQKVQAELVKYLALEEKFWKQKARMQWFNDGDRNTKLFHVHVNGRRKRLQLKRIQNTAGVWIEDKEEMANENQELLRQPTAEEVKQAMYGLNGDSAGGSDGFNGCFFHSCWDIVGEDVMDMVKAFFNGQDLPRFITHTNLVLLPKKKEVITFSDMRPISLSNFINKVFSRVIHERLAGLLRNLISDEQAGFVKGRSIVENVLLTQEIITDIRLRTKAGPNVVIKLDMMKAYRLSWLFLTKILRKMGFSERFIGWVFGLVSNNWYSVLINGQPHGFFKSTRGVKQGDPVSPTLFILAAEALSRGLNALHNNLYFCGFGLPKWSPKINHLAYAYDTIIFSSSDETSLQLIMQVLSAYEAASSQLINKAKSIVYMHHLTNETVFSKVERVSGIRRQEFPFTYLECPIFYAMRKMEYYNGLLNKVLDKL
ncbi:uncharacterized protein LOC142180920 [Nicotiana tabacum]|uniref:Uncharacterized protein LOC142180920 n=1 Tax=Nicotiana tabacum TaxID=4097 RepID=A0AC58UI04_TOBAC